MERLHLLETIVDTVQDGVVFVDEEATVRSVNRWMEQKLASRLPLVGRKCYEVFERRSAPCPGCAFAAETEPRSPSTRAHRHTSSDGVTGWYEVTIYPLRDAQGCFCGVIEHVRDITERRRAEELLTDEIARRRILVEQSRDGIVVLDHEGRVYEANERYARMLGYALEEVYRLHIWDWDVEFTRAELLEMIEAVDEKGDHFETRHRRKDGSFCDVEISSNGAVIGGRKLVFCVCRDVTEKKRMEHQIRELAIRDPLTGVFNRRHIFERLEELSAEYSRGATEFCISILDLDHFKTVNDTHGHMAGDFVLTELARTISALIRPYDLLGRYGGEEFIIVSRNARVADTAVMVERLMEEVRRTSLHYEGRSIRVTFSCGLADSSEFPRHGFSFEALASLADKRLYQAKAQGRDRCVGLRGAALPQRR